MEIQRIKREAKAEAYKVFTYKKISYEVGFQRKQKGGNYESDRW